MSLFHVEHWGVFIKRATTRDCPYNDIYQFYGIVSRGTLSLFSVQCRCFTWNIGVFFCAMSLFHVEHWGVFIKRATTRDCPYNDIYQFYGIVSRGTLSLFSVQCRCFTWNIGVFFCAMSLFHVEHWGVFIKRATTRDCPYNDIYQFCGLFHVEHYRCFLCNVVVSRGTFGRFYKKDNHKDCPYNDIYQFYGFFHVEHYCFFLCNIFVSHGTLSFL